MRILFNILAFASIAFLQSTVIPDSQAAIKKAEEEWLSVYGESIFKSKPFNVVLLGDTMWHVYGKVNSPSYIINEKGDTTGLKLYYGGIPHIFIMKSDGRVVSIYHTK
jgi:hypothetical protein